MEETVAVLSPTLDRPARRAGLAAHLSARGYRLGGSLGSGTTGAVYRAEHALLGRTVAVKLLTCLDPRLTDRALLEARFLARVRHPNVVEVHDVIRSGKTLAVVMEYCPGGTLADRLRREGSLDCEEALGIVGQAASALAQVHRLGCVHRDVKPANLFLCGEGVKLGDFGLLCPVRRHPTLEDRGGTPYYMAPEAWRGVATPRTDLHSLGVMLFEMLLGRYPFEGATSREVAQRRLEGGPCPVAQVEEYLRDNVRDLLSSLLAFRPEDRPANAVAVVERIDALLASQDDRPRLVSDLRAR